MPYRNLPESEWGKMDRCVESVQGQGHDKQSAIAICYTSITEGKSVKQATKEHTNLAHRVLTALIARFSRPQVNSTVGSQQFTVTKEADGKYRWVIVSSSSFEDRDKEIVSQKALEDDVAQADRTKAYGPLLWWHLPQAVLGECDFNAMHGRLLVESGTFKSTEVGAKIKEANDKLGASLGFRHPESEPMNGVFYHIRRYERSLLPRGRASNYLTAMPVVTKETVNMEDTKIKELKDLLGGDDALVGQVLTVIDDTQKAAEGAGLRTKAKTGAERSPEEEASESGEEAMAEGDMPKDEMMKKKGDKKTTEKKEAETIGSMTVDQLGDVIGRVVEQHILARSEKETQLDTQLGELKTAMATVAKAVNDVQSKVKELTDEAPKGLKGGFRASTDDSTKIKEGSALKDRRPSPDDFLGQIGAIVDAMDQRPGA